METVLCFGDSNTWGYAPGQNRRFNSSERWPSILQQILGDQIKVIEEGLPGRTTVHDDPVEGKHKNGARYLLPCLETHHPDLVILLLGTNDLKHRFGLNADDISRGAAHLVEVIQGFRHPMMNKSAKVLLVAPPPIFEVGYFASIFEKGEAKSRGLGKAYSARARELNCEYLDAGSIILSCSKEGIHWQQDAHKVFAEHVAGVLKPK